MTTTTPTTEPSELQKIEARILAIRGEHMKALLALKTARDDVLYHGEAIADLERQRLKLLRAELRRAGR